jgi:hypothetical protein
VAGLPAIAMDAWVNIARVKNRRGKASVVVIGVS